MKRPLLLLLLSAGLYTAHAQPALHGKWKYANIYEREQIDSTGQRMVEKMFADMFIIGFKVAGPVIAVIFITNIALGVLARTVPQINIFILGMPIKILVALVVLILVVPVFSIIMDTIMNNMYGNLETIIKGMIAE